MQAPENKRQAPEGTWDGRDENSKGNAGCEIYSRMKTIHKNLQEEAYKQ